MQQFDYEDPYNQLYGDDKQLDKTTFDAQMGFVKKVYSILSVQLLVTTFICAISMVSDAFLSFQINNIWLFYFLIVIQIGIMYTLVCSPHQARTVPNNYILLFAFTLCESYIVSVICGLTDPKIVFSAVFLTVGMFLGLTIYAMNTKTDFTMMGGFLFAFVSVMIFASIILMFIHSQIAHMIYCILGVMLMSLYIIYDTQLMMVMKTDRVFLVV
ncbi:hypothetical protein PPERSA_09888 [Pseudocohnilembus persalinus]|uniref:Inhibitor of apoptosis-promoting Bax1-domain-containing protein n=1 Tax=Pseudocohnilembus persalinus TaxID=266149 RepID=A0A0V0QU15_PSEPJ|nr:hypothetical protein PPERSA_09888 [Pseudocohnilembus persalinus]|eukprot:KRX05748.1 hypothetical protein PPERSA_09888 [Pseudocohnilembus persalinus]